MNEEDYYLNFPRQMLGCVGTNLNDNALSRHARGRDLAAAQLFTTALKL